MKETVEQKIGRLEREHDMWRGQVEGFLKTVAHQEENCPDHLSIPKTRTSLREAREKYAEVCEELEAARAERNSSANSKS